MKDELENNKYSGMKFHSIPFISATKSPDVAETFARGHMVKGDSDQLRKVGKIGRIFVYVFTMADLKAMKAVDVVALHKAGKIDVKHRYLTQEEVTFTGAIPSKNLVTGVDVLGSQSEGKAAKEAKKIAADMASRKGGLRQWK